MKFIGILLLVVAFCAINHGGGVTFTLILMILGGFACLFPGLLRYIFEENVGERK